MVDAVLIESKPENRIRRFIVAQDGTFRRPLCVVVAKDGSDALRVARSNGLNVGRRGWHTVELSREEYEYQLERAGFKIERVEVMP